VVDSGEKPSSCSGLLENPNQICPLGMRLRIRWYEIFQARAKMISGTPHAMDG
jgi:hypothetical protein